MKEGDRRSALKLITSQTMMAESADNLAALLSQFPDDTATLIIGLTASTKDSALVKKIGEAINLMEPSVQKEIAVKSYMRTKGSEALIASLWAGNARVGIAEILKAISEAIDPQTGRDIILSAARSRSEHMRLAVVRSTSESDEALLVPLMSDPSINVSKAAAQKLIKQETPAAKLTEFLKSAQPGVRAAVVEHKNATRPLVISAFGDTDPTVRTLAFTRMSALLTADETELAASAAKDDEILWRVAEHNTSTCAALATCFNKLLRNTAKIVDQPEEGHNEDYNDGYSSGSNWVVDKQEVSHNEVPAQDMQRAIALCTARGITLEQITKGLSRDISGQFTRDFMPVLIKSVIDRFNALKPGQQLEPALSDFVAYVCSLPPENAAKLVSELEPAKAAAVLKKMPAEKATALSVHFTQVFLVNLFLFGQR